MTPTHMYAVQQDLLRHRARIAWVLLVGFAALGMVAYLPSMWLAIRVGAWGIAILDTVIYLALLGALVFGRRNYWVQAGVVVTACYLLGLGLGVLLGPHGAGPVWLMATPIAAAILFDRRGALLVLLLVGITTIAITALAYADLLSWSSRDVTSPVLWLVLASNALLLAAALALAVITLIRGLQREMTERRRAENQLRQAEKLQAVGTLAAGIAHDFNNLLTPILIGTELGRAEAAADSAAKAGLDQAFNAAVAGRDLVQRILSFSRPTRTGRTAVLASEAFGDAVRLLRASTPGSISVELTTDGDGCIALSPAEIHQIVLNLGTNAQKAMPEGGRLSFRIDALAGRDVLWTPATPRPERVIRLEVTDTGTGMSEEIAGRIFEPFFTTRPERGTGIGLATVHGIVASVGGAVRCRSAPGRGTTFIVDLPAVEPVDEEAPHAIADATTSPDSAPPIALAAEDVARHHVLVVDDERAVREVAARVLARRGFQVTALEGADEALELLRNRVGSVAAIVTDLHMPGMNGLQLAGRVRSEAPGIALVLMTGLVDEAIAPAAEIGVDRVIAKPFRLDELITAVETALLQRASAHHARVL